MEAYPLSRKRPLQANHGLCCWNDGKPFRGPVHGYPTKQEHEQWIVRGCFCSWSCAKQWLIDRRFRPEFMTLLHAMAADLLNIDDIAAPGPPTALRHFGGNITLKEYRSGAVRTEHLPPDVALPLRMQDDQLYRLQQDDSDDESEPEPKEDRKKKRKVIAR